MNTNRLKKYGGVLGSSTYLSAEFSKNIKKS